MTLPSRIGFVAQEWGTLAINARTGNGPIHQSKQGCDTD